MKLFRITTVPESLLSLLKGQMRFMSENGFEVTMVSSDGKCIADLKKQEGCKHVIIPMTRKITPLRDLIAVVRMVMLFMRERPDIVHTHTPKAGLIGMLAAFITGVPLRLHTVAGLPLLEKTGLVRGLLDFIEKLTYKLAHMVYPNSHGLYQIILNNGYCTKDKIKVILNGSSNGIDISHFNPKSYCENFKAELRADLNILSHEVVFVFVGRMVKDKGVNEIVKAFKEISMSRSTRLLLVGPQETCLDPLLSETLEEILKNSKVTEFGAIKDIRPYLAISDVLLLPSYREGFPNVVMQAGAMGLPCIVSNINGCNEIIIEGENGLIIPVKNELELKLAMEKFLNINGLKLTLQANARNLIASRYDQKKVWEAILKEYKEQINV